MKRAGRIFISVEDHWGIAVVTIAGEGVPAIIVSGEDPAVCLRLAVQYFREARIARQEARRAARQKLN